MAIKTKKTTFSDNPLESSMGVIYGGPTTGKTFMGTTFPNPAILGFEGNAVNTTAPTIDLMGSTFKDTIDVLDQLIADKNAIEHNGKPYNVKFLIIDSITRLIEKFKEEICKEVGIEDFSESSNFGQHHVMLEQRFVAVMSKLEELKTKGIGSVLIVHTKIKIIRDGKNEKEYIDMVMSEKISNIVKRYTEYAILLENKPYRNSKGENVKTGDLQHVYFNPANTGGGDSFNSIRALGNYVPVTANGTPITRFTNKYSSFLNYVKLGIEQKNKQEIKEK